MILLLRHTDEGMRVHCYVETVETALSTIGQWWSFADPRAVFTVAQVLGEVRKDGSSKPLLTTEEDRRKPKINIW